jgi:arabinose-5-phosphate isomerase
MAHPQSVGAPPTLDFIATGRHVLNSEADALRALAQSLDANFSAAVMRLTQAEGHVIVTGMGKSGHIARKIAATMASTGTPAYFVHPGEASHGDLGMITAKDVVIAISNSGETKELADVVAYTRRNRIPLIGITSGKESALAEASDILLLLPKIPEVCPNGIAPTTSTTMTLGIGDALAVAAMEQRGFTAEHFSKFHPGGKLGNVLKRVEQIMHSGGALPLVQATTLMSEALVIMSAKALGCVGVLNTDGTLAGIITDGDLRRHMGADLLTQAAAAIMTKSPQTISGRALAVEALQIMNDKRRTQLFVTDDSQKPVGLIHIHDLLRAGIA